MDNTFGSFQQSQGNFDHRHGSLGSRQDIHSTPRFVGTDIPSGTPFSNYSSTFSDPGLPNLNLISPTGANANFTFSPSHDSSQVALTAFQDPTFQHAPQASQDVSPGFAPPDPLERYVRNKEEPWNPQRVRGQAHRSVHFGTWQEPVRSLDVDSQGTGRPRSDSGYSTNPRSSYTATVISQDYSDARSSFSGLQPYHSGRQSAVHRTHTAGTHRKSEEFTCRHCGEVMRVASELKKHVLKHVKPFLCDQPICSRIEGFITQNDLDRHRASVHKIYPPGSKVYVCASAHCAAAGRIWPRLDNYKQHITRMHKDESLEDLVERSTLIVPDSGSVDPADPQPENGFSAPLLSLPPVSARPTGRAMLSSNFDGSPLQNEDFADSRRQAGWNSGNSARPRNPSMVSRAASDGFFRSPSAFQQYPTPDQRSAQTQAPNDRLDSSLVTLADAAMSSPSPDISANHRPDPIGPAETNVIVHHQDSRQQQEQDLAHLSSQIAAQCCKRAPAETMEQTIFKVLKTYKDSAAFQKSLETRADDVADDVSLSSRAWSDGKRDLSRSGHQESLQCKQCPKIFGRPSDLRKHMHRHTKPFRCTDDDCNYATGSKNDWKRHENTEHYLHEAWRCKLHTNPTTGAAGSVLPSGGGQQAQCAKVFYKEKQFKDHLQNDHKNHRLRDKQIKKLVDECRAGPSGHPQFWCGFCQNLIKAEKRGFRAWNERWDHIGKHLLEDHLDIQDWVSLDENLSKRQIEQGKKDGTIPIKKEERRKYLEEEQSNSRPSQHAAKRKRREVEEQDDVEGGLTQICCTCGEAMSMACCPNPACQHYSCAKCRTE